MSALRSVSLDDAEDLDAMPGTRPWAVAVKMKMSAALNDERSSAQSLDRWRNLFIEHKGYAALAFPSFEAFCHAPVPDGLGYAADAIDAIIEERKSIQAQAAQPAKLHGPGEIGRGRNRDNVVIPKHQGNSADYLTARIARDRPDILARMQAGEFPSVAAAARAAGIEQPQYARLRTDDPEKAAATLAKHFDSDDIRAICDLALFLLEGGA